MVTKINKISERNKWLRGKTCPIELNDTKIISIWDVNNQMKDEYQNRRKQLDNRN